MNKATRQRIALIMFNICGNIDDLTEIMEEEQNKRYNLPDSLADSPLAQSLEEWTDTLGDAITSLEEARDTLEGGE